MDRPQPSFETEIRALRAGYAALNRNDIPSFLEIFNPQITRSEFIGSPEGGSYHGLAAVKEHFLQARGTWAEGGCEPEEFIVAGDRLIVFVHVRVRLKQEVEWREARIADAYTFHNGKVTQFHTFADRRQALEWAGLKNSDAN